ncbi:hypothetical protein RJ639_002468 [Escallonia herrerae]|uniref:HVA22-like protein n=1 Tax=Escallonia herrerae TaxID=1293975 RepID=A0AA88XIV3_9ASTE|nr:hypothetical protein RJ639_002468 [Escallonia herrerae]
MGRLWTLITHAGHDVALPFVSNMLFGVLRRIPIWYDVKLAFVAWLVLPQFRGAAFIYNKFVREKIMKKYGGIDRHSKSPNGKGKNKFVDFITPKKLSMIIGIDGTTFIENLSFVQTVIEPAI